MRVVKSVFRGITFLISELKAGTAILHGNGGEAINRLLKGTRAFRQRADGDQVESGTRTDEDRVESIHLGSTCHGLRVVGGALGGCVGFR
jgi:hypothetical protein